jgi:hypothetical protein
MPIRVVTVPYRSELGRFDDRELRQITNAEPLVGWQHHLVVADGSPHLVFVLDVRKAGAPRAAAVTSADTPERTIEAQQTPRAVSPSTTMPREPGGQLDTSQLHPAERATFQALRQWRSRQANDQGVPHYVVLTNRHLLEIVQKRPQSATQLASIHGIGRGKVERYGAELLEILAKSRREDPPNAGESLPATRSSGVPDESIVAPAGEAPPEPPPPSPRQLSLVAEATPQ